MKDYTEHCCLSIIFLLIVSIGLSIWSLSIKDEPRPRPKPRPAPNPTENILLIPKDLLKVLDKDIVDAYYEAGKKIKMGVKVFLDMGKKNEAKKLILSWYIVNKKLYDLIKNLKLLSQKVKDQLIMMFSKISKMIDPLINKNGGKEDWAGSDLGEILQNEFNKLIGR